LVTVKDGWDGPFCSSLISSRREVIEMAPIASGKGLRRMVFGGGKLHILSGADGVIVQVRSDKVITEKDALSPACKVGIFLDRREVFEVIKELLGSVDRMKKEN
jgi:hypothetical protein